MFTCISMAPSSCMSLTAFIFIISLSQLTEACFIRNCPKGGKRSLDTSLTPTRECMTCGPSGLGQCVGPSVCCSPHFGCHMNTEDSAVCQQENKNTAPCSISGQVCGARDTGRCVADGVCCDSDVATAEMSCENNLGRPKDYSEASLGHVICSKKSQKSCSINEKCILNRKQEPELTIQSEVLQLIEKLLRREDYD